MMKTILCYGDSITWGYNPQNAERFPPGVRWTSLLQKHLGQSCTVIEEGLCGRYTVHDEPWREGRNGAALLTPLLESHQPVDLVVLFLGTNDILHFAELTAADAARGIEVLVKKIQTSEAGPAQQAPAILLISPPLLGSLSKEMAEMCHGHPMHSLDFAIHYETLARTLELFFLDAAKVCLPSHFDGVHPDADGHKLFAEAATDKVKGIFAGTVPSKKAKS